MDKRALLKGWLTLTTVQCVTNIVVGLAENNLKHKFYPNATNGACIDSLSPYKSTHRFIDECNHNQPQLINCTVASSCNGISSYWLFDFSLCGVSIKAVCTCWVSAAAYARWYIISARSFWHKPPTFGCQQSALLCL